MKTTHEKMQTNTTNMATIDLNHECIHKEKSAIWTHLSRGLKTIYFGRKWCCLHMHYNQYRIQQSHNHIQTNSSPPWRQRLVMDTYMYVVIYIFYRSPSQQVIELGWQAGKTMLRMLDSKSPIHHEYILILCKPITWALGDDTTRNNILTWQTHDSNRRHRW